MIQVKEGKMKRDFFVRFAAVLFMVFGINFFISLQAAKQAIADDISMDKKKAVIVAAGSLDDYLWQITERCANVAYQTLAYKGYTSENIMYLTPNLAADVYGDETYDADGDATKENLEYALTEWAKDAEELIIYMTGHGGTGYFYMNKEETLRAEELDQWLDTLQETISGRVIFIYEGARSGSFISPLTSPPGKERIVITSSSDDEPAYFTEGGIFSFSFQFWANVFYDPNLFGAFDSARGIMTDVQTAWLDGNSDGIGYDESNQDIPEEDREAAEHIIIGNGRSDGSAISDSSMAKKKAVLVAGCKSYPDDFLWSSTENVTNEAYFALLSRGYTRENILYLSPNLNTDIDGDGLLNDTDKDVVKANLEEALTVWAKDAEELIIYMTGYGGGGFFTMNKEEKLGAEELDQWLDTLQETISGRVIFIYDSSESGSFIPLLTPPPGKERIAITSSSDDEYSLFIKSGNLSFSSQFWANVFYDPNLFSAFEYARRMMMAMQTPWLDGNGDGIGYDETIRDIPAEDKETVKDIIIGKGRSDASAIFDDISVDRKKAVIVAGTKSYPDDYLWNDTWLCATEAYLSMIDQDYTRERIYFLSPKNAFDGDKDENSNDVDGDATLANLEAALKWAEDAGEVLLYMTDHGTPGEFVMNKDENLKAEKLDELLDDLQEIMPGRVIVIYDACHSGSFISKLKPRPGKKRIVITSSAADETAWFTDSGMFSFSYQFWAYTRRDGNLYRAFDKAAAMMDEKQKAWLDADGDGIGWDDSIRDVPKFDKERIKDIPVGRGWKVAGGQVPVITAQISEQTLNGETFSAFRVAASDDVTKVWAVILRPDYPMSADTPVTDLPTVELTSSGGGSYEGTYSSFDTNGTFKITVYAQNAEKVYSSPALIRVIQTGIAETKGDLDGDKTITLTDAVAALKLLGGELVNFPVSLSAADVNNDGHIGLAELIYILKRLAN
jgi:glycosylphosphatidylinositol transamidase (GPIT) subunit GPI8